MGVKYATKWSTHRYRPGRQTLRQIGSNLGTQPSNARMSGQIENRIHAALAQQKAAKYALVAYIPPPCQMSFLCNLNAKALKAVSHMEKKVSIDQY